MPTPDCRDSRLVLVRKINRIKLSYSPVIQPGRETTAETPVKPQYQRRHSGITGNGYE
ncbi:protein of unknown function [Pararobbsia alpina]